LKQLLYLAAIEGLFEEIPFVDFYTILRKKLLLFSAGVSAGPTIKIYFVGHLSPTSITMAL
jgi:hypothetical protein